MQVRCVSSAAAVLGEGPLWDAARELIWWVDIKSAQLHAHHLPSGANHRQDLECRLTSLGLDARGGLVASGDLGIVRLQVEDHLQVAVTEILARIEEPGGNRFNDGKVDSGGCFWAGTMDDSEREARGSLYRLDRERGLARVRSNMQVPNGPCFLADGTMLITDTARRQISAVTFDEHGAPLAERAFAHFSAEQGYPDGMTTDAEDHVWIAFWDGWCVRRLSPEGRIVAEIALPVQRPTCPVFAGEALDRLYVTSARIGLGAQALACQPHAGGLLMLEPGVRGLPPCPYAG